MNASGSLGGLLIAGAEMEGVAGLDVHGRGGRIVETGSALPPAFGERTLDARGCALLPSLHDCHALFAWVAASRSVRCGPPEASNRQKLEAALAAFSAPRIAAGTLVQGTDFVNGVEQTSRQFVGCGITGFTSENHAGRSPCL